MLQSVSEIGGYRIRARDGSAVGEIRDLRLRDTSWAIRFIVVETGGWRRSRKILIPTDFACSPDIVGRELALGMSSERLAEVTCDEHEARSLRGAREVIGLSAATGDETTGHVDDLLFDDTSWVVRYAVIDTGAWLTGRKVLISTAWIQAVDWPRRRLRLAVDRKGLRQSPTYDPGRPLDRDYDADPDRLSRCRLR